MHKRRRLLGLLDEKLSFVDIGARDGLPERWRWLSPTVIQFEPEQTEAARIGARPVALSSKCGSGFLYVTRSPGCSSLLKPAPLLQRYPDSQRFEVVSERLIETISLDAALDGKRADFIKIDVQGAALDVLKGASNTLSQTLGLEIECEFVGMYEGQPLFSAIHEHLSKLGFELVDLRPTYWRRSTSQNVTGCKGQLIFCDALYLRSPESLIADERTLMKMFAICEVYGLSDYAVAYADGFVHPKVAEWMVLLKRRPLLSRLSKFKIARGTALAMQDVADAILSGHWATSQQSIGNTPRHRFLSFLR